MSGEPSAFAAGTGSPASRATAVCSAGAGLIGVFVVGAWAAGSEAGAALWLDDGPLSMPGAVALCFLAAALWLRRDGANRLLGLGLAGAAGLVGVVNFVVHLASLATGRGSPFETSVMGALAVSALAVAVGGLDHTDKRGRRPTHLCAVVAAMLAVLAGLGHLYEAEAFYRFGSAVGMAPHSSVAVGMLALGVLASRRGPGALQVLTSEGPGGVLARRLLPGVVLLPPVLDVVGMLLERWVWLGAGTGQAMQTVLVILLLGGFMWRVAARANDLDVVRSEAEKALRESERGARETVESLPQLVWTCAPDGTCDYLSPQWVRYTGRPEREQLGFGWLERLHPDDRERTISRWRETAAVGVALDIEFRIRRHDGAYRWFKTRAEPLRDAEGRIRKWFGTNTDVDDQRRAEDALREAHDALEARVSARTAELELISSRLRAAMELAALGVWDWLPGTRTLIWDQTLRRIYGVGEDEPISYDTWYGLVVEEERATAEAKVLEAIRGTGHYHGEFRIRRRDGAVRVIESLAVLRRGADGATERMIGVNRDVTEQREAEQALRASEALLREFVTHAPAAIAMLDDQMRYLQVSDRWLTDYHLGGRESIIGRGHYEVFPEIPEHWREIHRRVLAGAVERCDDEPFPRQDGRTE